MNLKDIDIATRKKLTSGYPALLCGTPGSGKSTSVENLPVEDKKRTFIVNMDNKAISDDDTEFFMVVHPHDKSVKASYSLDDPDMPDNLIKQILFAGANDKVDRIIIDTSTELLKFLELWSKEHFSGFDSWNAYNNSITKIFNALKETVITYGKFVYVFGHYPPLVKGGINNAKRYLTTKGNEHKNVLEEKFSTVVEAVLEDRQFWYSADSFEEDDTTKTKVVSGHFRFARKSLHDLELVLTRSVTVNEDGSVEFPN